MNDTFTYLMPKHGWTCYHCGETFKTPGAAHVHFGGDVNGLTGCQIKAGGEKGLLMALREAEEKLIKYRFNDIALACEVHQLQSRHSDALRDAEEVGYERGYAAARKNYK